MAKLNNPSSTTLPLLQRFYPEARFGGFSDVDGTITFYTRVQAMLSPDSVVLDVGCGRGAGLQDDSVVYRRELRRLRGRCQRVIGIGKLGAGKLVSLCPHIWLF